MLILILVWFNFNPWSIYQSLAHVHGIIQPPTPVQTMFNVHIGHDLARGGYNLPHSWAVATDWVHWTWVVWMNQLNQYIVVCLLDPDRWVRYMSVGVQCVIHVIEISLWYSSNVMTSGFKPLVLYSIVTMIAYGLDYLIDWKFYVLTYTKLALLFWWW